jgi:hypothetical protein
VGHLVRSPSRPIGGRLEGLSLGKCTEALLDQRTELIAVGGGHPPQDQMLDLDA